MTNLYRSLTAVALGGALTAGAALLTHVAYADTATPPATTQASNHKFLASDNPHMRHALRDLHRAKWMLQHAPAEYEGHRVAALEAAEKAIEEVDKALDTEEAHDRKEKKLDKGANVKEVDAPEAEGAK